MNLNQLRFAAAVAHCRSFSRAATACHITQPSLSTAIAQLEQELGGRLFDRTTRQVRLTPLGRDLLPLMQELLDTERAIREAARRPGESRRVVRVGFSPAVHLAPVHLALAAWRRDPANPEVVLKECLREDLNRRLGDGTLDLALVVGLEQPSRHAVQLHEEPLMLAPARHEPEWGAGVALKSLAGETFVFTSGCGLADAVRQLFRRARLTLREYPGQALSYRVVEEWAELGLASGVLPRSKLAQGNATAVPLKRTDGRPIMLGTYALRPPTQERASPSRQFLAWLEGRTAALAAGAR